MPRIVLDSSVLISAFIKPHGLVAEMVANLDASPWRAPDVFLFRYSPDGYTLKLARDVYPNDPNVSRYTVTFPASAFAGPQFTVTEIGPFVLVVRNR